MAKANSQDVIFEYQKPLALHRDLWVLNGTWKNKFARRMTVLRTEGGSVVIHNPMRLHESELEWLRSLGSIEFLVAPNKFHTSDLAWMAERFDGAKLIFPTSKTKTFLNQGLVAAKNTGESWTLTDEIDFIPVEGMNIEEVALFHRSSQTLVLCDLAFNMADVFTGMERFFMSLNKVGGRFGPSLLAKFVFTNDRKALLASVDRLAALNPKNIVVGHGDVFQGRGGEILRSGFAEIFG